MNFSAIVFASFAILNSSQVAQPVGSPSGEPMVYRSSKEDSYANRQIPTGSFWVSWYRRSTGIGRHRMMSIDSYEYVGAKEVDRLSPVYDGDSFTNFHIVQSFSTINESTVSTTVKFSSKETTTLASKIGLDNVTVSNKYTISSQYEIENTATYTYSEQSSLTIECDIKPEIISGRLFAISAAAFTYRLHCQTWQYDDLWTGHKEVSGSRKLFTTYLTLDPFITVAYLDGTVAL